MPLESNYLFVAAMDVDPDKEPLLNEVYDTEHVPLIASVRGVRAVTRFRRRELNLLIGGEKRTIVLENEPKYAAVYEVENPAVLLSDEWARKVEEGRWSTQVRPYTRNRRLVLWERIRV